MSRPHTEKLPIAECSRCHKLRTTVRRWEMICYGCYKDEPKSKCGVCGKEKRFVVEGAGVCLECIRRAARRTEIECSKCGKSRTPSTLYGDCCSLCQWKVNCGQGKCSMCGKDKAYAHQQYKLCRHCNLNRVAPRRLQRYVETVSISNEYCLTLFQHVLGLIKGERVNEDTRARVHEFGAFLQGHQFHGPLTWESIAELGTTLPGKRYSRVRFCLKQLGELLLDQATDEALEETKGRIKLPVLISSLEADLIAVFKKYDLWLSAERRNTPTARGTHLRILGRFWRWCAKRGLTSLATVEAAHVEEYLHTLGLKWKCGQCSFTKNVTVRGEAPPTACEHLECRALHSYEKVIRCAERTVDGYRGTLGIFFGWLRNVEGVTEVNPAPAAQRRKSRKRRGITRKYPPTIQYYEWEVVEALLEGIEDPDTPAEEAGALYFILYHAFYLKELQTVQIPSQCRPVALGGEALESLENVLSLEWRPRELSRNKQFLGRSGEALHLEPTMEPWLQDLIRRFMLERNQKLRNPNNPYLFVGTGCSPRKGHVSISYLSLLVERATARILGRVCTLNILAKSSRLLYSEFGGYEGFRHLRELGLSEDQARSYPWHKRVRVVPKQIEPGRTMERGSRLAVPSRDVFGIPTHLGQKLPKG